MRAGLAFADILEDDGAVIDAGYGHLDLINIDRFHGKAICILARQDYAGSLEPDKGRAVCKVDRNGFAPFQGAAICGWQAREYGGGAAGAESKAADAKLAAFNRQRSAEGRTEFHIGGVVGLGIESGRKHKAGKGLFGGGVDPVAEIGEVLFFGFTGFAAGFFPLARGDLVCRRALDKHIGVSVLFRRRAGLGTSTRGKACQKHRKNKRFQPGQWAVYLQCHECRPPNSPPYLTPDKVGANRARMRLSDDNQGNISPDSAARIAARPSR